MAYFQTNIKWETLKNKKPAAGQTDFANGYFVNYMEMSYYADDALGLS